jgi:hypothetical protein
MDHEKLLAEHISTLIDCNIITLDNFNFKDIDMSARCSIKQLVNQCLNNLKVLSKLQKCIFSDKEYIETTHQYIIDKQNKFNQAIIRANNVTNKDEPIMIMLSNQLKDEIKMAYMGCLRGNIRLIDRFISRLQLFDQCSKDLYVFWQKHIAIYQQYHNIKPDYMNIINKYGDTLRDPINPYYQDNIKSHQAIRGMLLGYEHEVENV